MMGYYDVLEEIERLDKANINQFTCKDIANNLDIYERRIREQLSKLVSEGLIDRVIIKDGNGYKNCYYTLKKTKETEGFINDIFKAVADLLH